MDKREQLGHLLTEAIAKARELKNFALDPESRGKGRRINETSEEK